MDPIPENNRAAWYQGPMKLEVVNSCGATRQINHRDYRINSFDKANVQINKKFILSSSWYCAYLFPDSAIILKWSIKLRIGTELK